MPTGPQKGEGVAKGNKAVVERWGVAETWAHWDLLTFLQQVGKAPS